MAESGPVGHLRSRAVGGLVSADAYQGDSYQEDSYQGTSSDVPQGRITNAPLGAAFPAPQKTAVNAAVPSEPCAIGQTWPLKKIKREHSLPELYFPPNEGHWPAVTSIRQP